MDIFGIPIPGGAIGAGFVWFLVLAASVGAADWGADRLAVPFQKLKAQFGLSGAAGGALIAMVTAGPEVGINTAAALQGVGDIGLGTMLGANIVSVPLILTLGVAATAWYCRHPQRDTIRTYDGRPVERTRRLQLEPEAATVQGLPYLGVVALVALLTLPAPWRGLQPVDGWIMLGAFVAFYAQALLRHRGRGERASWSRGEVALAVAGIAALGGGAWLAVTATENLTGILGISQMVGGLFIAATMSVAPEAIKTWVLIRVGQATAGTTSVIADNAVTMTLGFLPLALVTTPVEDVTLYALNLGAVFVFGALFTAVAWRAGHTGGVTRLQLAVVLATYAVYVVAVSFLLW